MGMNYLELYADFIRKNFKLKKPLKVIFDCSNGTTGLVIEELRNLEIKKLDAILINEKPDGRFPAHGPNPMLEGAIDDLSKAVLGSKADRGVIFDADGDRVFFVDDKGRLIIPDAAIFLLAKNFKGPVVLPVNVGILARELLAKERRKIIDSRIGHYFIKKLIKEKKINFAAEISGHYYFKKFFYADSGIFSAMQFINIVSNLNKKLSEWIDSLPKYFRSGELNFTVHDKDGMLKKVEAFYKNLAKKISHLDGLTVEGDSLAGEWRFNLRPSNTEDLLRLNLEAKDGVIFKKELKNLRLLLTSPQKNI